MGMFDTVVVKCPNCSEPNDIQSKAGNCVLDTYNQDRVPVSIATAVDGATIECGCGARFTLYSPLPAFVSLVIEEI